MPNPNTTLMYGQDYTVEGNRVLFTETPRGNHQVWYSAIPADESSVLRHEHYFEETDTFAGDYWDLSLRPDIGHIRVVKTGILGNLLWVAWKVGAGSTISIRLMDLNDNGTFLGWKNSAITGFDDVAGEYVTCMAAHPRNPYLVYVATKADDTRIRLYRSADWATVTKVVDIDPTSSQEIVRIYVEQGTDYVWFAAGKFEGVNTADALVDGVWGAADGITFTLRGNVAAGKMIADLWVKENAPRTMWAAFHNRSGGGATGVSYSTNDGVTWTDVTLQSPPFGLLRDKWTVQAFPPLTGATNLIATGQLQPASGLERVAYSSANGGLTWATVGSTSAFQNYRSDGGFMFSDPAVGNYPNLAATSPGGGVRTTNGGATWGGGLGGATFSIFQRMHTIHWTLNWMAVGKHAGVGAGTNADNRVFVSVDKGATWADVAAPAGFNPATLRVHGVALIQNLTRDG